MTKHREYPMALKQAAVARVAAWESFAEVARDLKLRGRLLVCLAGQGSYGWAGGVARAGTTAQGGNGGGGPRRSQAASWCGVKALRLVKLLRKAG
jgi:hypothetical protein